MSTEFIERHFSKIFLLTIAIAVYGVLSLVSIMR